MYDQHVIIWEYVQKAVNSSPDFLDVRFDLWEPSRSKWSYSWLYVRNTGEYECLGRVDMCEVGKQLRAETMRRVLN